MDGKDLGNLCFDDQDSDVKLIFETEEAGSSLTIPAHSLILKRASRVFRTMLESQFIEARTGKITFDLAGDVTVGLYFVRFLYTKTLPVLDLDLYIILVKMGRLYEVTDLADMCEERIWLKIDPFSICRTYQTLEHIASVDFLNLCMSAMLHFAFLIFLHGRHLSLSERIMKQLLQSDALNVLHETQAVEALWQWGSVRCVQENRPGNVSTSSAITSLLPYIRWAEVKEDTNAPWYFVAVQQKKSSISARARNGVRASIPISPLAKEVKFEFKMEGVGNTNLCGKGEHQMVEFVSSVDMLLCGFSLVVCVKKGSWEDSLGFTVNKMDISDRVTSESTLIGRHYLEQVKLSHFYTYHVKVELFRPVLLQKCSFNSIGASVSSTYSVAMAQNSLKSGKLFLSSGPNAYINVYGKVSSIASVLYLAKS